MSALVPTGVIRPGIDSPPELHVHAYLTYNICMAVNNLYIIGIGYRPFDKRTREIILGSDVILLSKRLLDVFSHYEEFDAVRNKVSVPGSVDETIEFIHDNRATKKIVLAASGDPLFSGIGKRAVDEFGKTAVVIIPDLSSVQMAFARIKETWEDAFFVSLHGGPDPAERRRLPYEMQDIPFLIERYNKIAILTDRENSPSAIAQEVVQTAAFGAEPLDFTMYVCERLGYENEKITAGTPEEIAGMSFEEPNVVVLLRSGLPAFRPSIFPAFGLSENEISHSRGLITKDEVRAATIHKLRLPKRGVLWDIGAGSGSIAIEASRLFPSLNVFAVEKDMEQVVNIRKNRVSYQASNIKIIEGAAPDVLRELPAPDRVFIGGSGGRLGEIMSVIAERMPSGIVVINATKMDTLNKAIGELERTGFVVNISQVSVSRTSPAGIGSHLSALNPVFIISGNKNGG